jgi:RNA polymerase sigma-70 factor (ECF subfamily)
VSPAQRDATGWALAARHGDPAAQAEFVRATQAEVWRFAASLVDPDSADDLTQETYLRAFRALPAFEGRSSARTWLLGIARRTCADHLRSVVRRRRLEARLASRADTGLPHPDPSGHLGAADLLRRLPEERHDPVPGGAGPRGTARRGRGRHGQLNREPSTERRRLMNVRLVV